MIDTPMTWRDGATVEGIPPAPARPRTKAPAGAGELIDCAVLSIPQLTVQKAAGGDMEHFKTRALALRDQDTRTLIARISTADDALMLWALHLTLDKHGIAPALRWPANTNDQQAEFITFAADLFWLCKRHPNHRPAYRGWVRALAHSPASPQWHTAVHQLYRFVAPRRSLSHYSAKALALTERQRLELQTLPSNGMQAERRQLQPERFADLRARLLTHTMGHPDKSGAHQPHDIANRRAALWRTYVLSGRRQNATAANWALLTGETVSRQALSRQLSIIEDVLRDRP